jgi:pimeloyl-ACP methyl ester carboxylesterase
MPLLRLALAASLVALAACATASEPPPLPARVEGTLLIGGETYAVDWGRPAGPAIGLAVVEHGFTRRCSNLAGTLDALVAQGLVTLCVNASMAGGNPALADDLADTLIAGVATPWGEPAPERIVVGGHSAGGAFAARLGATLAERAPQRLVGAVLFDPVAAPGFVADLRALAEDGLRAVFSIGANASGCNADQNALPGLRAVLADAAAAGREAFVGLQLTDRSTHVDAEGSDGDLLGWVVCRQGPPRPANVGTLRTLAGAWAADLARGTRTPAYYPGGAVVQRLLERERALVID